MGMRYRKAAAMRRLLQCWRPRCGRERMAGWSWGGRMRRSMNVSHMAEM